MFNFRGFGIKTKSIFSTISFAAVFLVIILIGILFNLSLHSIVIEMKKQNNGIQPPPQVFNLNSSSLPSQTLLSIQEETQKAYYIQVPKIQNLIPTNQTDEETIEWMAKRYPEFEMIESTRNTRKFDWRARKFFGSGCKIRFFMTWISPAMSFGKKEFFAVESLFKSHPNGCLMILSWTMDSKIGKDILNPLTRRGYKVIAVAPNLPFLFDNTPAVSWFDEVKNGKKETGQIPFAQNLSNLLRLVLLYKYGGVYLDTDFIILKDLSGLRNSIGAQSMDFESKNWTRLNNAVLIFDKNHPLVYKFIEEFSRTFDGNKWGHNGPYLVSRVIRKAETKPGFNFTVLPPMAFYPVDWIKIGGFFLKPKNRNESKWVAAKLLQLSGDTYAVHLWNKQSSRLRIEEGSIIGKLINDHCVICERIYDS